jgi:LysM repeat protein
VIVRPTLSRPTGAAARAPEPVANNTPRTQRGTPAATPAATTTTTTQEAAAPATKYTVKQGDTFWKIAQSHKTTPEAIMKANNIRDAKKLKPGMQLRVP